jgi:hypothetical protein
MTQVHSVGIDVQTDCVNELIRFMNRRKSTISINQGAMYREDQSYSKVLMESTLTADEIEDMLYRTKHGIEYVGCYSVN